LGGIYFAKNKQKEEDPTRDCAGDIIGVGRGKCLFPNAIEK
jgi:hypothetical protein